MNSTETDSLSFHTATKQLAQLEQEEAWLKTRLSKASSRKLTPEQKESKNELARLGKKIKTLHRSICKLTAIQEAARKIGKEHGIIHLYGIEYRW